MRSLRVSFAIWDDEPDGWVCEELPLPFAEPKPLTFIADKAYMLHINMLDKVREEWQSEHIKACEVAQPDAAQEGAGLAYRIRRVYFCRNVPSAHYVYQLC